MTLGIPPVVTDILGNREWIKDGSNGYLVPTRNPREIATKIIELARNVKLRREIGENAHKTIDERINWDRIAGSFDNMISRLAKEK